MRNCEAQSQSSDKVNDFSLNIPAETTPPAIWRTRGFRRLRNDARRVGDGWIEGRTRKGSTVSRQVWLAKLCDPQC